MNRIFTRQPHMRTRTPKSSHPRLRPPQRVQRDVETMLRDIAYVLHLTRRVKAEMLEERELADTAAV